MIDYEWYRSFLAVYRSGTVSRAAEHLLLTQPAVSQHIAALEVAVGMPLFQRLPRRMVPTERGKALYQQIVAAMEQLEQVEQSFGARTSPLPLVRMGAPAEFFYAEALPRLQPLPIRLWVQHGLTETLLNACERGDLDIVFATQRSTMTGLEWEPLHTEEFVLIGNGTMPPLAAEMPLGDVEQWLEAQRWVSYGAELPIIRRYWRQIFHHRPPIQPHLVVPDLRTVIEAVALGYGVSIVPRYLCQRGLSQATITLLWDAPEPVTNDAWLVTRKGERHRTEFIEIRDALKPRRKEQ